MRYRIIFVLFLLFPLTAGEASGINPAGKGIKDLTRKPKPGFGITLSGGSFHTFATWTDTYFDEDDLNIRTFWQCGGGLIVDFPLSRSTRLLINPEFTLVDLDRALISSDLSIQQFLSRSFFIQFGGSAQLDDFQYGGAGPTLGLGFKAGGRFSLYLQGRAFYKKMPETGEFVSSHSFQVPASFVVRFDLARTFKKIRTTPEIRSEIPDEAEIRKPEPDNEKEIPQVKEPEVTVKEQIPEPEAPKPELPADTGKLPEYQPVIRAEAELQPGDTSVSITSGAYSGYSYEDLEIILEKAVGDEDYHKAEKIQNEISAREAGGDLKEIPTRRLEELLQQALKTEDYLRAATIQDEISRRK
ncbi:MAG: hypothetical protein JXR66_05385 [Bacteroidales bacterium]|nr:hypothetical protein [Bacteroidales bacterium]